MSASFYFNCQTSSSVADSKIPSVFHKHLPLDAYSGMVCECEIWHKLAYMKINVVHATCVERTVQIIYIFHPNEIVMFAVLTNKT